MFYEGQKVIYMQTQPIRNGSWWKELPATVLAWIPETKRYKIVLETGGRPRYVASYSIRAAQT